MPVPVVTNLGRGSAAYEYLLLQDINPVIPHIRSSDFGTVMSDPFKFYLRRRLGLVPALKRYEALDHGTWAHTHFEHMQDGPLSYQHDLDKRLKEIRATGEKVGFSYDRIEEITDEAKNDCLTTKAWMEGAAEVKIPACGNVGYREFFTNPDNFEIIGHEVKLSVPCGETFCTIQIDLLVIAKKTFRDLNIKKGLLYIVDLKTCKEATDVRAASCPADFQTWHYPITFARGMREGCYQSLLPDVREVGGVIHLIVQKPTIRMGAEDRPYNYVSVGKRSGVHGECKPQADGSWSVWHTGPNPNAVAGSVTDGSDGVSEEAAFQALWDATGKKPDKEYTDDPDPKMYQKRVREWYLGVGVEPVERSDCLPVNISVTNGNIIDDPEIMEEYEKVLAMVEFYATCDPYPSYFPRNAKQGMVDWKRLSPYAPFYTQPVHEWPEIIARNHMIVEHRDE
jgi:hypothetical protein